MTNETSRWVTLWREPGELDWKHYVSFDLDEAERAVANLKKRGVTQYTTAPLGAEIAELSSGGAAND